MKLEVIRGSEALMWQFHGIAPSATFSNDSQIQCNSETLCCISRCCNAAVMRFLHYTSTCQYLKIIWVVSKMWRWCRSLMLQSVYLIARKIYRFLSCVFFYRISFQFKFKLSCLDILSGTSICGEKSRTATICSKFLSRWWNFHLFSKWRKKTWKLYAL